MNFFKKDDFECDKCGAILKPTGWMESYEIIRDWIDSN